MNTQIKCITNALTVLAYNNGFTLWHYKGGQHTLAQILQPGYFNPVGLILRPDDQIHVSAADAAALAAVDRNGAVTLVAVAGLSHVKAEEAA